MQGKNLADIFQKHINQVLDTESGLSRGKCQTDKLIGCSYVFDPHGSNEWHLKVPNAIWTSESLKIDVLRQ